MLNRIIAVVGIALWLSCAIVAVGIARIVPILRSTQWLSDIVAAIAAAFTAGFTATALDFGGWNEADWRAGLFVFLFAFAIMGWLRTTVAVRKARS